MNYKYKFEDINVKAIGRSYNENGKDGSDVTVSAIIDFPSKLTSSMLLTLNAGGGNLDRLNYTSYIGKNVL